MPTACFKAMCCRRPGLSMVLVATAGLLTTGCYGPSMFAGPRSPAATKLIESAARRAEHESPKPEQTAEEALAEVIAQLEEIDAIDPVAGEQLQADLREADQGNWPLIVSQFKTALAYRQQLAERDAKSTALKMVEEKLSEKSAPPLAKPQAQPTQTVQPRPPVERVPQPVAQAIAADTVPLMQRVLLESQAHSTGMLPPPPVAPLSIPTQSQIQQVSYSAPSVAPADWRTHLHAAIDQLEQVVAATPTATPEVRDHMQLRLLRLVAGDDEAALDSIPGATAGQQDYWSKQLFALSTYLDVERQPNDKLRAAGSAMYLDQARAKLAEQATLQLRNLAFVDSVGGYGVYEPHEKNTFRPGEQVNLYTELQNFRSESTREGFRTLLGTSYEVLDASGQRVDGNQFPDVEDVCRNTRQDFHMQYWIDLPTRIYPGKYELRLTITDHLSQKIGQASVPFEIVE